MLLYSINFIFKYYYWYLHASVVYGVRVCLRVSSDVVSVLIVLALILW